MNRLVGTWSRTDEDGDSIRYAFDADGTLHMTVFRLSFDTSYRVEGGVVVIHSLEPGAPDNRLTWRVDGDLLSVAPENAPAQVTVLKRE